MILMLLPNLAFATGTATNTNSSQDVAEVNGVKYATLIDAVNAAYALGSGQTITLLKDYEVETSAYTTYLMPDDSTLDLGQKTLTVPYLAAAFEGTNITIKNGKINSDASYSIWIGNGENETSATLNNITSNSGANVFAASATFENCNLDASAKKYYSVWADQGATVTVKSGFYKGGENGAVGTAGTDGKIEISGGTFTFNKLVPSTNNDNIVISGGEFSSNFDAKYLASGLNLIKVNNGWTTVAADKKVINTDGSTTETKSEVSADGSSTVTETTTKINSSTGVEIVTEVETKRDENGNITQVVNTSKEITKKDNVTTTEQTVAITDVNKTKTVETTKIVEDATNNIVTTTGVRNNTANVVVDVADSGSNLQKNITIDATAAKADESNVKKAEVTLSANTTKAFDEASVSLNKLDITTNVATLSIDSTAIKTLSSEATNSSLKLSLDKTDSTVDASKSITATYELTASVDDRLVFTENNKDAGTITVNVPYENSANKTLEVYYIPNSGDKELINSSYNEGVLSWKTNHFSTYEVVESNVTENPEATTTPVAQEISNATTDTTSENVLVATSIPDTGDVNAIVVLIALTILCASATAMLLAIRKNSI